MLIGLELTITGANLSAMRPTKLVRNGRNQYAIHATLDSQWDGLVPYACFTYGTESCKVKIQQGQCTIPDPALAAGAFDLGVCGVGEASTYVTNLLHFQAVQGVALGDMTEASVPSEWEAYLLQVDTACEEAVAAAETATKMATTAVESVGGVTGATFTPSVSEDGDLSWSNDRNLENPVTVNIKGEKGDTGEQGLQGESGEQGEAGADFTILDLYGSYDLLVAAVPVGVAGQAYAVGDAEENEIYLWSESQEAWVSIGNLQGQAGADGQSPFDVAVEGGYTGSESNFNDALSSLGDLNAVLDLLNGEVI